jgi:hypothetical protein
MPTYNTWIADDTDSPDPYNLASAANWSLGHVPNNSEIARFGGTAGAFSQFGTVTCSGVLVTGVSQEFQGGTFNVGNDNFAIAPSGSGSTVIWSKGGAIIINRQSGTTAKLLAGFTGATGFALILRAAYSLTINMDVELRGGTALGGPVVIYGDCKRFDGQFYIYDPNSVGAGPQIRGRFDTGPSASYRHYGVDLMPAAAQVKAGVAFDDAVGQYAGMVMARARLGM